MIVLTCDAASTVADNALVTLHSHSAYYYTILETETNCDFAHLWLWYRLQIISDQRQDTKTSWSQITDHPSSELF